MSPLRLVFALTIILLTPILLFAQPERPEKVPPGPDTELGRTQLQARKLFAQATLHVQRGLFLDAQSALEECLKLDAEAVPPRRLLARVYLNLARPDDALAMARQVTEKAPDDYDGWQAYATHLKDLGRTRDAIAALTRAIETESAARYPGEQFTLLVRLADWSVKVQDWATVEKARRKLIDVLEKNRERFQNSGFLSADDYRAERAAACEGLGTVLLRTNRPDEAAAAFEEARSLFAGRDDLRARLWLHRLHWHQAQVCN